jgi:hypothetical protein
MEGGNLQSKYGDRKAYYNSKNTTYRRIVVLRYISMYG